MAKPEICSRTRRTSADDCVRRRSSFRIAFLLHREIRPGRLCGSGHEITPAPLSLTCAQKLGIQAAAAVLGTSNLQGRSMDFMRLCGQVVELEVGFLILRFPRSRRGWVHSTPQKLHERHLVFTVPSFNMANEASISSGASHSVRVRVLPCNKGCCSRMAIPWE